MDKHLRTGLLVSALMVSCCAAAPANPPTVPEARAFLAEVERTLLDLSTFAGRAEWIKSTYITEDTEAVAARAD